MCLNRSFAHARGVMNGLLRDVSACTSPAQQFPDCAADLGSLL